MREVAIVECHPGNYQVLEGHDFCLSGQILRVLVRFIRWNEHGSHERRDAQLRLHTGALQNTLEYQLEPKTGLPRGNGPAYQTAPQFYQRPPLLAKQVRVRLSAEGAEAKT